MCRLLGIISKDNNTDQIFKNFAKLALYGCVPCGAPEGHTDGWGGIIWKKDSQIILRDKNSISNSLIQPLIDFTNKNKENHHGILHIRKASVGKVCLENTHPYYKGGIAFAHNGSIKPNGDIEFITDHKLREGQTDSETFFLRILEKLEKQTGDLNLENIKEALQQELEEVKKFIWTSATCIFATKEGLVVNYLWNENHSKSKIEEFEKYYTLYEGKDVLGNIFICSEMIDIPDVRWFKLENNTQKIYKSSLNN